MKMFTKVFILELQSVHDIVQYCFIFIVLCYCFEMHFVALCCVVLCCVVMYRTPLHWFLSFILCCITLSCIIGRFKTRLKSDILHLTAGYHDDCYVKILISYIIPIAVSGAMPIEPCLTLPSTLSSTSHAYPYLPSNLSSTFNLLPFSIFNIFISFLFPLFFVFTTPSSSSDFLFFLIVIFLGGFKGSRFSSAVRGPVPWSSSQQCSAGVGLAEGGLHTGKHEQVR